MSDTSLTLAPRAETTRRSGLRELGRKCEDVATDVAGVNGPGAGAVRAAAHALAVAIQLYEQQRRRMAAEVLRPE
jgi:hypothetical protein